MMRRIRFSPSHRECHGSYLMLASAAYAQRAVRVQTPEQFGLLAWQKALPILQSTASSCHGSAGYTWRANSTAVSASTCWPRSRGQQFAIRQVHASGCCRGSRWDRSRSADAGRGSFDGVPYCGGLPAISRRRETMSFCSAGHRLVFSRLNDRRKRRFPKGWSPSPMPSIKRNSGDNQ
jgi:hypothetical protein